MPSKRKHPEQWTENDIHDWHMMLIAKRQIELALYSFEEMVVANDTLRYGQTRNDNELHRTEVRLWVSAQAFLSFIAQLSDLFWTIERKPRRKLGETLETERARRGRAVRLSRLCGVAKNSPFHDRAVRNGFTHIFEAVEKYVREHPGEGLSDWGRINPHPKYDEDHGRMIRCIDPSTLEIYHLGSVIDSRRVAQELKRVRTTIREHLPADKRHDRLIRRLERQGQALAEEYGDLKPIPFPADWSDNRGPPPRWESPSDLLLLYQVRHNAIVVGEDPEKLGDLFAIDGEMAFYGIDNSRLDGRKEIVEALRSHPPTQELLIDTHLFQTDTDILATYGWGHDEGSLEGLLRLQVRDGKISWLQVFKICGTKGLSIRARARVKD
jgi:hypothetical protein